MVKSKIEYYLSSVESVTSRMAVNVPSLKLNNGYSIPIFGLGTWKSKPGEVAQAVRDSIDAGYRHFDCAFVYGNEKEVGEGIRDKIKEGTVKRSDLFITSKLWNTFHLPELVVPACKKTLENLGLDYLDLYLIHWPMAYKLFPRVSEGKFAYSDADYVDTWPEMEKLVDMGLVRSIGVSNFSSKQIERVLAIARIKPVTNQVECNPYLNQKKLQEFCKKKDILLTGYSPLGSPDSPFLKPDVPKLLEDPKLKKVAEKYKKSIAQVVLRYLVQRDVITIPKSVSKERISQNIAIFDFKLSPEDMAYLDSFDCGGRLCSLDHATDHPHYPFNIEKHWCTPNKTTQLATIGLGTWKSKRDEVTKAVEIALDAGYTHIDCARIYENEDEVGAAIQNKIKEGIVKREELFITSKLWNTYHRPELVVPACQTSLKKLCLDYLDLYLIHWPFAFKEGCDLMPTDETGKFEISEVDYVETWKGMEKCAEMGLVRSIGLSNFNSQQIQRVLDACCIKPVNLQVECHPYFNQKKLREFCNDRDIVITAYSPLGSPDSPYYKEGTPKLLEDATLKEMGDRLGKTVAQVILRYLVQLGVATVPKSVTPSRIQENFNIFDFELTAEDMACIDSLDQNLRYIPFEETNHHPDYPFNIEF
ncbi:hypothetical protein L9F63_004748 [Diploptera punctata]|uniref:NADP-dependent oxidoreductase domain-containing protein n=1 Tax=Diploptera punctata TaxID=6984 RepID=A0AAD7ZGI9_DIPPU|nr:hypothetical protein L9F63_004748 [Diploptera punctata]